MLQQIKRFLGLDIRLFDDMYTEITRYRFSLRQESEEGQESEEAGHNASEMDPKPEQDEKDGDKQNPLKKPIKIHQWRDQPQDKKKDEISAPSKMTYIAQDLAVNRRYLEQTFELPSNADIIIRDFTISTCPPTKALVVYVEGLSDKTVVNDTILKSLMQLTAMHEASGSGDILETVKESLLPGNQLMTFEKWDDVISNILMGTTALFIEGSEKALIIETKGWQQRSVSPPRSEQVIRGSYDAFTENLRTNTALIRLRLQTNALVTEMMKVGKQSSTTIAMMYIKGIVNPALVKQVKKRIKTLDTDTILDSGMIEQLIEDQPYGFIPTILSTERPDRVSSFLAEGHIALIINNSPFVLVVPVSFWSMLHTAEDAYLRWPFGTFLRVIRLIALFSATLLPGIYIAITNYHAEMIPTELMIAMAASKEYVPFPVVLEVLLMEFSIELIREAGVRIPSIIGPTIGIVGALILGQAAVQAGIVSPILVIVVAVTALASFTIPNYNLAFGVRFSRFFFLIAGAMYGFFGLALLGMVALTFLASLKSFGVPVLAPLSPYSRSKDTISRKQMFQQEERPTYMASLNQRRQSQLQRKWDFVGKVNEQNQRNDQTQDRGNQDDT
jgi:spore germination protein KA